MASNDQEDNEKIKDVIVAMKDSLASYLHPESLLLFIPSMDDKVMQELQTYAESHEPKETMYRFLDCLIESDVSSPSLIEFLQVVKLLGEERDSSMQFLLSSEGLEMGRSILDMANLFVDLVEGRKFEKVTCLTIQEVLAALTYRKMVEKNCNSHKIIELKPLDAFMEILKLIQGNQPNWPFVVWDQLKRIQPELFNSTEQSPAPNVRDFYFQDCGLSVENSSVCGSGVSESGLSVENPSVSDGGSASNIGNCLTEENSSVLSSERGSILRRVDHLSVANPSTCASTVDHLSVANPSTYGSTGQHLSVANPSTSGFTDAISDTRRDQTYGNVDTVQKTWMDRRSSSSVDDYSDGDSDDEELYKTMEGVPDLKLRNYQLELAEEALDDRNVIVCAPTGSGKTRVAMLVIIKHLEKASEKNAKKVCFFTKTVPLAVQQYRVVCKHLPQKYKAVLVTGNSVHCLDLGALLPENDVVVLTPMVLQNHFKRGLLQDLSVFTLLVFDECHHTRKDETYNILMLQYLKMKINNSSSALPQVLGLTASLPTEKADSHEDAKKSVLQICANLAADDISTVRHNIEELRNTVPNPQEDIELLFERRDSEFVYKVNSLMRSMEKKAQQEGSKIEDAEVSKQLKDEKIPADRKSQQYNQWTVNLRKAAESVVVTQDETNMAVRILMILAKCLMEYNIALEAYDLVHLGDIISYLDKQFKSFEENESKTSIEIQIFDDFEDLKRDMDVFQHEENPNLTKLVKILETYLISKGEQSRGIIFVKTRALAEALKSWLRKSEKPAIVNLRATIFTGTNASESEGGMTQAQQDFCVESFREGSIKLLIATSVAEEGIDVPECNLVIKYNYVGNEISTIQTKGRSRKQGGRSILLAMPSLRDRELKNKMRAKMMFQAVENIQDMPITQRLETISYLQMQVLKDQEMKESSKQEQKKSDKRCIILCKLCRKSIVTSDYVRSIEGVHRVVIDWDIWKNVKVYPSPPYTIDDIDVIGGVRCQATVESHAICGGVLGTAVMYRKTRFLALGIKNIGFVEEIDGKPEYFKQWKKVIYTIKEIDLSDIASYLEDSRRL